MADQNTVHVGMPSGPPHASNYDVRLVKVETDVAGLKSDIAEISTTVKTGFKEIATQVSAKGQINWAALGIVAVLLVPACGWAWGQIGALQSRIDTSNTKFETALSAVVTDQKSALSAVVTDQKAALAAAVAEQKATAARFIPRDDINAQNAAAKEIADLKSQLAVATGQHATSKMLDDAGKDYATKAELAAESREAATRSEYNRLGRVELRERVMKLEDNIVSRREHEVRNSQVDHAIDALGQQERRDNDEIKRRLDDLYPASTVLKDLSERTHALELQTHVAR